MILHSLRVRAPWTLDFYGKTVDPAVRGECDSSGAVDDELECHQTVVALSLSTHRKSSGLHPDVDNFSKSPSLAVMSAMRDAHNNNRRSSLPRHQAQPVPSPSSSINSSLLEALSISVHASPREGDPPTTMRSSDVEHDEEDMGDGVFHFEEH